MFTPTEKGTTIRVPSTANLMVDSADRPNPDTTRANDFQITRTNSILNGYFTRIGTTEVVLEYNTPNISTALNNNTITIDLSGGTTGGGVNTVTEVLGSGIYTQAAIWNWVLAQLNAASASLTPAVTWTISATTTGYYALVPSANVYVEFTGTLATQLDVATGALVFLGPTAGGAGPPAVPVYLQLVPVDLRPFRYLDFVSAQLTYNQDLKDSSTAVRTRDVLCRWYMAWDQPPELDQYGFPILMGYTPFTLRRIFSPPKQIRWDNIQPLGNIAFQVYTDQDALAPFNFNTNWLMTLQVSEV